MINRTILFLNFKQKYSFNILTLTLIFTKGLIKINFDFYFKYKKYLKSYLDFCWPLLVNDLCLLKWIQHAYLYRKMVKWTMLWYWIKKISKNEIILNENKHFSNVFIAFNTQHYSKRITFKKRKKNEIHNRTYACI